MAVDPHRGIVYVPTGSAASDFYGADRVGDDLFANCLLALDAKTGKRIWHFQGVKHDLWDRDFPSPPVLVTVHRHGKPVDAVAESLQAGVRLPVRSTDGRAVVSHRIPALSRQRRAGGSLPLRQPLPTRPAPFARQLFTEDMVTNRTPEVHQWALERFRKFRSAGQFVPFSVGKDTVVFPGYDGGAEWGGPAVDPETKILYVNSNDIVDTGALEENTANDPTGRHIYLGQCALCHHDDLAGAPPDFPSLQGIGNRMSQREIATVIRQGRWSFFSQQNSIETSEIKYHTKSFTKVQKTLIRGNYESDGNKPTNFRFPSMC